MDKPLTYSLDQRVSLLALQEANTVYNWNEQKIIWAKAEPQAGKNLYSTVGIGVKSVKFTVWKQDVTLHNAFRWNGNFCFLTDITEIDRMYYEIMAAMIEPKTCTLLESSKTKDALQRPVVTGPQPTLTFPGCLVEKYMGFTKLNPQSQTDETYVLVTPKVISLSVGNLIEIGDVKYNVQATHGLDEFKNEYEIAVKKEA